MAFSLLTGVRRGSPFPVLLFLPTAGIYFLVFLLLASFSSQANSPQELEKDTATVNRYLRQGNSFWRSGQLDSAELYLKKGGSLAKELKYYEAFLEYTGWYAGFLYGQLRFADALAVSEEQLAVAQAVNNTRKMANAYNNIALQYQALNRLPAATEHYLQALQLAEQLNDLPGQQKFNSNLASVFYELKNKEKSLYYSRKGYAVARQLNDSVRISWSMGNLIIAEVLNGLYDSAIIHSKQVVAMGDNVDEDVLLTALNNLGEIHVILGNYTEALSWFRKEQARLKPHTAPNYETHLLAGMAKAYAGLRQFEKANTHFEKIAPGMDAALNGDELRDAYLLGAEIKEALHQLPAALEFRKKYMALNDSILNATASSTIHEMETRYQTAQKEQAITRQQLQISRQQHALDQKNKWILGALFVILALATAFIGSWYVRQQKRKAAASARTNELLQARLRGEEEERSRTAKELHDGVGSILSAAKMHLYTLQPPAAAGYDKAVSLMESAIQEVRNISHNMSPEIVLEEGLEYAVKSYCARISHPGLDIEQYTVGTIPRLSAGLELLVYRIIQEAVNNIIKHAEATQAIVQLSYDAPVLMVTIEDNGIGFDPEKLQRKGIGLSNLPARVRLFNGHYQIVSSPGEGTTVSVELAVEQGQPVSNI
ncbi:MAG: sensor histidine kinase [Candidatus Pseudobacter hemicellulosilyticus]|uniref:Oxygen sensor histidine kinase NreB n=1 Tax=Candidatus Pseudobacter hemicellulosilyticus TaxID=3121375 RepID=A0AAJ5WYP1_9BACT|nr:MAG: sensor histidine kinase [Pseudobacter sp.]